jgi:branched-subunit amino acid aminotransferase/4-amino-4-deoxychorismate lyase
LNAHPSKEAAITALRKARATIFELAQSAGIPVATGGFPLFDVYLAEEAFLTATSFSILPVASVNGKAMGGGAPGPVTRLLTKRWSELVGIDIIAQALGHVKAAG